MSFAQSTRSRGALHRARKSEALKLAAMPLLFAGMLPSCDDAPRDSAGSTPATTLVSAKPSSKPTSSKGKAAPSAVPKDAGPSKPMKSVSVKKEECASITATGRGCPEGMARINWFCMDRYEAHLENFNGDVHPQNIPPGIHNGLKAVSSPCVLPQTHMTWLGAQKACETAGKRLCKHREFKLACEGPMKEGPRGSCNIDKRRPHILKLIFPETRMNKMTGAMFNDPRLVLLGNGLNIPEEDAGMGTLEEWESAGKPLSKNPEWYPLRMRYLVKTGEYLDCHAGNHVYDLIGNASEHVDDEELDAGTAEISGYTMQKITMAGGSLSHPVLEGCEWVISDHVDRYKDYSTGFRCCAQPHTR